MGAQIFFHRNQVTDEKKMLKPEEKQTQRKKLNHF